MHHKYHSTRLVSSTIGKSSPFEIEHMYSEGEKAERNSSTYVTKLNGKLVIVRKRPENLIEIGLDLLTEAFSKRYYKHTKMDDKSKTIRKQHTVAPVVPMIDGFVTPLPQPLGLPEPPESHPKMDASLLHQTQGGVGSLPPNVPIYQKGNQQLALLPLDRQGGPAIFPYLGQHQVYPFSPNLFQPMQSPQPAWVFPGGFNDLPKDCGSRQYVGISTPNNEPSKDETILHNQPNTAQHKCANCGRIRSPSYHHENQLKPGEIPVLAFCKKCRQEETSSDESERGDQNLRSKKNRKGAKIESINSYGRIRSQNKRASETSGNSIISDKSGGSSGAKVNVRFEDNAPLKGKPGPISYHRSGVELYEDETYRRPEKQFSPPIRQVSLKQSESTDSSQGYSRDSSERRRRSGYDIRKLNVRSAQCDEVEGRHDHHSQFIPRYEKHEMMQGSGIQSYGRGDHGLQQVMKQKFDKAQSESLTSGTEEPSTRRRRERSLNGKKFHHHSNGPLRDIRRLEDDGSDKVTQNYAIRPRNPFDTKEEEIKDQERELVENAGVRLHQQFADREGSHRYEKDRSRRGRQDIRRHFFTQSDLPSGSEIEETRSSEATMDSGSGTLSALGPMKIGASIRSLAICRHHEATYPESEDREFPSQRKVSKLYSKERGRMGCGYYSETSNHRPPSVMDLLDRGTNRAMVQSPKRSSADFSYPEDTSESMEGLQRLERHVTFRDATDYAPNRERYFRDSESELNSSSLEEWRRYRAG